MRLGLISGVSASGGGFGLSGGRVVAVSSMLVLLMIYVTSLFVFCPAPGGQIVGTLRGLRDAGRFSVVVGASVCTGCEKRPVSLRRVMRVGSSVASSDGPLYLIGDGACMGSGRCVVGTCFGSGYTCASCSSFSSNGGVQAGISCSRWGCENDGGIFRGGLFLLPLLGLRCTTTDFVAEQINGAFTGVQ